MRDHYHEIREAARKRRLISVIMPVYLGDYQDAAKNREDKFIRAVGSFIRQEYKPCELIIISDGCDKAEEIYRRQFMEYPNIRFRKRERTGLFAGEARNLGLRLAHGDIVCYLDSDDYMGTWHLKAISEGFEDNDFVYYNDFVLPHGPDEPVLRDVSLRRGSIGTSSWAHKRDMGVKWRDGYNHDWWTIAEHVPSLMDRHQKRAEDNNHVFMKFAKITGCAYYVCHMPKMFDV